MNLPVKHGAWTVRWTQKPRIFLIHPRAKGVPALPVFVKENVQYIDTERNILTHSTTVGLQAHPEACGVWTVQGGFAEAAEDAGEVNIVYSTASFTRLSQLEVWERCGLESDIEVRLDAPPAKVKIWFANSRWLLESGEDGFVFYARRHVSGHMCVLQQLIEACMIW